jgi:hypothetical protein
MALYMGLEIDINSVYCPLPSHSLIARFEFTK